MSTYNQTLTLSELPAQPLLPVELTDAIFVTVWLGLGIVCSITLQRLLKNGRDRPTWPEFEVVLRGTQVLTIWFLVTAIDRWMCNNEVPVNYSYIVFLPIREIFLVAATNLLLWGNYAVIWKELQDRFSPPLRGIMWFTAKFGMFVISFLSLLYLVLELALSVTWLSAVSLSVIADIASTRASLEISIYALRMIFSLLTLCVAAYALIFRTVKVHGMIQHTRIPLLVLLAATFMFLRSVTEFGMIAHLRNIIGSGHTRRDIQLAYDVSDGVLSFLYLAIMCYMAWLVASPLDVDGADARLVASDVRRYILLTLENQTNGARRHAPALEVVLRQVEQEVDEVLSKGPLCHHLDSDVGYQREVVLACTEQIRHEFGGFGGEAEFVPRRPALFEFGSLLNAGHGIRRGVGNSRAAGSRDRLVDPAPQQAGRQAGGNILIPEREPSLNSVRLRHDLPRGTGTGRPPLIRQPSDQSLRRDAPQRAPQERLPGGQTRGEGTGTQENSNRPAPQLYRPAATNSATIEGLALRRVRPRQEGRASEAARQLGTERIVIGGYVIPVPRAVPPANLGTDDPPAG
ncbi:hypothetical protein QBC47DRAFT_184507 [Echria macrotheca]|uniref:Uncharacterized protein n=1 Tax=Echria macrotheca TaxID=438768 RepID=A0AAJ0BDN1_9PEZI|nr:hypothetical protein QBC47DRAFT_184507 [Echria macrotheca]